MMTPYLLSPKFSFAEHGAFAVSATLVISGGEGYFRPGDVMDHMTRLISRGVPFDSQQYTELGQWLHRADDVVAPMQVDDDAYYAWVDPDFWDLDPHLGIYTRADFMTLFEDCCRNFVAEHMDRAEEFADALRANGMSLVPTIRRP